YGLQPGAQITLRSGAIESPWGHAPARINAVGTFNTLNALGVLGCLLAFGVPFGDAVRQLAALPPVPGRMETIGERPLVVVDYAHTPDALEKVLGALRPPRGGVRRGRRSRSDQATADGRRRDAACRPGARDFRQPPRRGPGRDHP